MRVRWRQQTQASTLSVLDAMSHTVNEYIRSFPEDERQLFTPLHTIRPRLEAPADTAPPASGTSTPTHVLMFDGASRGNPGRSGAGAVLYNPQMQQIWTGSEYLGDSLTNNEAEYRSLILGLQAARAQGIQELTVHGDSTLVINQMLRQWTVNAPHLVVLYDQASHLVEDFNTIIFRPIPRSYNSIADGLSNQAIDIHLSTVDL
jgi:ribonuclease HI